MVVLVQCLCYGLGGSEEGMGRARVTGTLEELYRRGFDKSLANELLTEWMSVFLGVTRLRLYTAKVSVVHFEVSPSPT
jgi:hypothetical protein